MDPREATLMIIQMATETNMLDMTAMMIETIDTGLTIMMIAIVAVMEEGEVSIEVATTEEVGDGLGVEEVEGEAVTADAGIEQSLKSKKRSSNKVIIIQLLCLTLVH